MSEQTPTLNVNDLALMAQLITVCSKRGAFQAEEMRVTGELFDKLKAYLNHVQEQQKKLEKVSEEADGSGEGEEGGAESKEDASGN
tara:strand:+ start:243 stop:500 length:258 start_codon:yes stop_codon:yes gene_type:complete